MSEYQILVLNAEVARYEALLGRRLNKDEFITVFYIVKNTLLNYVEK